jgi:hypothetical protein
MRRRWQCTQLASEFFNYETILRRLGVDEVFVESQYYYYPHPRLAEVERVMFFGVRKGGREYGFSVHEVRGRHRIIWVDINPVMRHKIDDKIREIFRAACRSLVIRIILDLIFDYDFACYRAISFINIDEQRLIVWFKNREITIPVEQLSEQALLSALANFVSCACA